MLRIVARNGRSLSKIRIMPSAIVSNRMVYTGIMPLRHSRIIAAAASSVTAGLQMLAMDFCFMAWRKKIPERSEDDFLSADRPAGLP